MPPIFCSFSQHCTRRDWCDWPCSNPQIWYLEIPASSNEMPPEFLVPNSAFKHFRGTQHRGWKHHRERERERECFNGKWWYLYMGGSINGGTPKWMVYTGKSYLNGWFGGPPMDWKPPSYVASVLGLITRTWDWAHGGQHNWGHLQYCYFPPLGQMIVAMRKLCTGLSCSICSSVDTLFTPSDSVWPMQLTLRIWLWNHCNLALSLSDLSATNSWIDFLVHSFAKLKCLDLHFFLPSFLYICCEMLCLALSSVRAYKHWMDILDGYTGWICMDIPPWIYLHEKA